MSHAELSPSGASTWKSCTASPQESRGKPDNGNDAARNGTVCHTISSLALERNLDPAVFIGEPHDFIVTPEGKREESLRSELVGVEGVTEHTIVVSDDHVASAQAYVEYVRQIMSTMPSAMLMVENRVPITQITGEEDAGGTADAVIINGNEIWVIDLKSGQGRVDAFYVDEQGEHPNDQLAMYGDGATVLYEAFGPFEQVHLVIVQPPLRHVSECHLSKAELDAHIQTLREAAEKTRTAPEYKVSADNCRFCKGRPTCMAYRTEMIQTVFEDLDAGCVTKPTEVTLAKLYSKVELVEAWVDDIKAQVLDNLKAGIPVEGFKLVTGKRGAREWVNADEAEATLKKFRLKDDEMYSRKLISPTKADEMAHPKKGAEARIGERQWTKLQALIHQPDGKPVVAPVSDPRPAITPAVEAFQALDEDTSALFA